jgi:hypothetical protein
MEASEFMYHCCAVVIWLGYAIWWEHPGAELGCFFRLPGRGGHLGGPATKWGGRGSGEARGSRGGAIFFQGGTRRDEWLDRAGRVCPSWARKN